MHNPPPDDPNVTPEHRGHTRPPAQGTQPPRPEDRVAYRIAVGALGLALVAFLIGAAIIAAGGKPVPTQYWSTGSGIAGALIGVLAPSPTAKAQRPEHVSRARSFFYDFIVAPIVDLWKNRAVLLLLTVFGLSLGFAIANNSAPLETVAAAAGGALVGLLAPPPGQAGE